jgi:hypothetical protein
MTAPRDPDRLIRAFLEDTGTDMLPDRAFDGVRRDIHRTRQRVVLGPWREQDMSNIARYGVIAAAAVLLVGAGVVLLRPASAGPAAPASAAPPASVAPSASPAPSPSEAAVAAPTLRPNALPPGPVRISGGPQGGVDPVLVVTVPAGGSGWTTDGFALWKDYGPTGDEEGPGIIVWPMTGTFIDPCSDHTLKEPAPEGVEDLIASLGNQPGISSGPPTDVTVSGYSGQYVETTITADISTCGNGLDGFWLWASPNGDRRYVQDTGEINRMYAFDVDGTRFTFDVILPPATTDADRAEVDAMLETLEIEPVAASPSPAP